MTFNSVRHLIMLSLKDKLKTIKTANGYETNINDNAVREWEPAMIDMEAQTIAPVQSDYINIQDSMDQIDETTIGADEHILTVDLEFYASGVDAHVKMRKFAADLIEWVGNNRLLDGVVEDMELSGTDSCRLLQHQKKLIIYKTELDIVYVTNTNKAYH